MSKKQKLEINVNVTYEDFERQYLKHVNPVATKSHIRRTFNENKRKRS